MASRKMFLLWCAKMDSRRNVRHMNFNKRKNYVLIVSYLLVNIGGLSLTSVMITVMLAEVVFLVS